MTTNFSIRNARVLRISLLLSGALLCATPALLSTAARADSIAPRQKLTNCGGGADKDLLKAAVKGELLAVSAALDAGADVDATDKRGYSAMMLAVREGKTSIVSALLERGANANIANRDRQTALMLATQFGAPQPKKPKKGLGGILGRIKKQVGEDLKSKMGVSLDARLSGLGKVGSALMGNVPLQEMLGKNVDLLLEGKGLQLGNVSNWKAIAGTALVGDAQAGGTIGVVPVLSGDLKVMGASDWSKLVRGVDKANPRVMEAMKYLDTEEGEASQKWTEFVGLAQGDDQQPMTQMLADPVLQPLLAEARTNLISAVSELPGQKIHVMVSGLLSVGADASLTDKEGRNALEMAQERDLDGVVALLSAPVGVAEELVTED